ncbi:peptide/nickel transport system permease protein [Allocatelliglobosispora scoriae]|uniref:Peptide/nickel transport system permease protein n=1 Tax=Allocatelliglobosispora scoriae TaxID=643052 RepID=A0A841BIG4_9ACTN|nr:ABC transporter permease [Allocatelliglobosispora scoriae]MBB5867395.1 peptide/nickel transport system permease protein [Allocatelliglobosispora scoriae]
MLRFLAGRLAGLAFTLWAASLAIYLSLYLAPGSPEQVLFGSRPPTPEVRAHIRAHLGLDENVIVRYLHWLGHVVTGDLGTSLITRQPVADRLGAPATVTFTLIAYAGVLILVGGVGSGLLAAMRPGWLDAATTTATSIATAVPAFVASGLLIAVFAVGLGWFPSYGLGDGGTLRGLTLPAVALAVTASGLLSRVTRDAARTQLRSEHVVTARVRGISTRRLIRSHVLRNAAAPITTAAGLQLAGLITGAVVVEQAFGLHGLGELLVSSVQQKDFTTVQAVALIVAATFLVLNLAADVTTRLLDPRIRTGVPR